MFNEFLLNRQNPSFRSSALSSAMGNVNSALSATTPQAAAEPTGIRGWLSKSTQPGGFFERLNTFGAQLQDINDGGDRVARAQESRLKQQAAQLTQQQLTMRREAEAKLRAAIGGGAPVAGGATETGQAPNLRALTPQLLAAQAAGVDIGDYVSLLDKAQPNIQVANGIAYDTRSQAPGSRVGVDLTNVNGTLVDTQNPANANRFVPDVGEGQELLYDANGAPVVRNAAGYVNALTQREGAVAGAREGAQAPYRFLTTTDAEGRPVQTAISNVAGGSVAGADPVALASRERLAKDADDRLGGLRTKVSAGRSQLATFSTLERLLPDAITGPGADLRLQSARFQAALGNDEARRRVAATEAFQAQSRFVTADLVRAFGANPTEGERKYAEQMSGGDINITPEAIKQGFELFRQRIARDEQALARAEGEAEGRSGAASPPSRPRITPEQARRMLRERGVAGY